jgi:hypothetical protein
MLGIEGVGERGRGWSELKKKDTLNRAKMQPLECDKYFYIVKMARD